VANLFGLHYITQVPGILAEKRKKREEMTAGIIGKSKAAEGLRKALKRAAASPRDILIIGEKGTERAEVARALHELAFHASPRRHPFRSVHLAVNDDASTREQLFRSPHAKGPTLSTLGLLKGTAEGTLYLEDVDDAPFRRQRWLVELITRAGEAQGRPGGSHLKIIVSVGDDPQALQERQALSDALARGLVRFEKVTVPPLRERREDIPAIVKHIAEELAREDDTAPVGIDPAAIEVLMNHPWKGDVRELRCVVERGILLSRNGRFVLPEGLGDEKAEVAAVLSKIDAGESIVLNDSMERLERKIILRVLDRCGHNQSKAAELLGFTEQTLRYRLKQLGIPSSRARV